MNDKVKYYGFSVGDTVILNESYNGEYLVEKGTQFKIMVFPPCVIYGKYQYFVYGLTDNNKSVRVTVDKIIKP